MAIHRLTALRIKGASKPGSLCRRRRLMPSSQQIQNEGLDLPIHAQRPRREDGLGPIDLVSLSDARQRAAELRRPLLDGHGSLEVKEQQQRATKVERWKTTTFRDCAERYIASHQAGWRNDKHAAQWKSTLRTYAYPVPGDLPVAAVDTPVVMQVIEPLWSAKPETAGRVARGMRGARHKPFDIACDDCGWTLSVECAAHGAEWKDQRLASGVDHCLPRRSYSRLSAVSRHGARRINAGYRETPPGDKTGSRFG